MISKLLVKAILNKPLGYKWTIQGLGMLRLYLSDEVRLHIWDSRYKVPNVSALHTHPWGFHSEIVAGVIHNQRFTEYHKAYPFSCEDYRSALIKCGAGTCVVEESETRLRPRDMEHYSSGSEYEQLANEIHESTPEDGTVTIVTRTFQKDTEHARVFWKSGPFVSAEPRRAETLEVLAVTTRALEKWF